MPEDKDRSPNDAIVDAMKQIGLASDARSGGKPKIPADRVLELFQAAIQQGLVSRKGSPDGPAPAPPVDNVGEGEVADDYLEPNAAAEDALFAGQPKAPRKLSEWESGLQDTAREAFNEYILQNVSKDAPAGSEVAVDGAFVKEHGAALFGSVLQALVKSVVPPEVSVQVPAKKDDAAESAPPAEGAPAPAPEPQVKLKVDFAKILADLVANARVKKDQNPA